MCFTHLLTQAQLLAATGRPAEAADLLHGTPVRVHESALSVEANNLSLPRVVLWYLERARVNETLGRRDEALRDYTYVAQIWHRADAVLQPYVDEAREAMARLSGEGAGN